MKSIRIIMVLIVLSAAAIVAYFALTPKAAPEFISVSKISVGNVSMRPSPSFDLAANLEFNNPNSFGLNIEKVQCDVFIEGQNVTNIAHSEKIEVLPDAHFSIPLNTNIKLKEQEFKKIFGANLFESLLNNELKMKFVGEMTISKFGLSKNIPFSYDYVYKIL